DKPDLTCILPAHMLSAKEKASEMWKKTIKALKERIFERRMSNLVMFHIFKKNFYHTVGNFAPMGRLFSLPRSTCHKFV
ncbi:hypothetical protein GCK32_019356, partial [Trichostrongylus colubriformis]